MGIFFTVMPRESSREPHSRGGSAVPSPNILLLTYLCYSNPPHEIRLFEVAGDTPVIGLFGRYPASLILFIFLTVLKRRELFDFFELFREI